MSLQCDQCGGVLVYRVIPVVNKHHLIPDYRQTTGWCDRCNAWGNTYMRGYQAHVLDRALGVGLYGPNSGESK